MGLISRVSSRTYRLYNMTERILKPGLIWISSIPEGMNPAVIRQIFSKYGDVARIYLEPYNTNSKGPSGDAKTLLESKGSKKKQAGYNSGRFKEGWVEFESKTVAKQVASALNMQEIAEKKHGAWSGQFWSLKYLSKFKWDNLHEQLEHERQVRKKVIREEFRKAKDEQNEYLKSVAASKKAKSIAKRRNIDLLEEPTIPTSKGPKQRKTAAEYQANNEDSESPGNHKILSKFFG